MRALSLVRGAPVAAWVAVACAVTSLSCGASHPPEPPVEVGDFERDLCAPIADAMCARAERCGCGELLPGGVLDRAACVERTTARCVAVNAPSVAAGIAAEPRLVREYVAELASLAPCEEVDTPWERGLAFFPVEIGESCPLDFGFCAGSAGVCLGGHCRRRPQVGEPCVFGLCAVGLACRDDERGGSCAPLGGESDACDFLDDEDCAFSMQCIEGVCHAPIPEGGACAVSSGIPCSAGSSCIDGTCRARERGACPCAAGEACLESLKTCRVGGGEDVSCTTDRDCAADLWCDRSSCEARVDEGEPCSLGTVCAAGLRCSDGSCAPQAMAGEPCTGFVASECEGELACIDGTCGPAARAGEPCPRGFECEAGLECGNATGTCRLPLAEGAPCVFPEPCAMGLHCEAGACVAGRPAGAPCRTSDECAGACLRDRSGTFVCVDAPAEGDACGESADCPAGLQCEGEPRCVAAVCELW